MNSYKRNVYKTKNPPKPQIQPITYNWYISRLLGGNNNCEPIFMQVYKNPNSIPVQVGDTFYSDSNLTTPWGMLGASGGLFQTATEIVSENQAIDRIQVVLDSSSTVTSVETVSCVIEDSTAVFVSAISTKRCNAGSTFTTVYVNSNDIDSQTGRIVSGGVQLYSDQFLNNTLDPLTLGGSFSTTAYNFVGISPNGIDPSEYSMLINVSGLVIQPQDCI